MVEFLQSLDASAIIGTLIAYLTANFGVILIQCISSIKNRVKKFEYNKKIDELQAKYEAKVLELQEATVKTLEDMEKTLELKVQEAKDAEQKLLDAQTQTISENIQTAKSNLTIDQVLED